MWSRDPSPLLRYPSVYSCMSRLSSARRNHRFVYRCVIAGACFDVTVLAWHKYATLLTVCHLSFLPCAVLVMSVIGVIFLPVVRFFPW
jgi:uncharacterized protein YqiB (DUF1249 family)